MAVEKAPQPTKVARLLQEALSLSVEDREDLLDALQYGIEPEDGERLSREDWEAAWSVEIRRRIDNLEAGRTKLHSHEEVMSELESCLRQP